MMALSFCIQIFLALVALVVAQDSDQGTFIQPPAFGDVHDYTENDVWDWDSDQVLQWRSTWDEQNLKLYQNDNENFWVVTPDNFQGSGSQTFPYNATFPEYLYDSTLPPIFFFRMNNVQDDSQVFNSHYFNISNVPASITAPISTSTFPATSSTSTMATNSIGPSFAPDQTSTPVPQSSSGANNPSSGSDDPSSEGNDSSSDVDDSSSGLSGGAIAGIVVGAIAGVAIVAAIVVAILYRRRKGAQFRAVPTSDHARYGAEPEAELPAGQDVNGYYNKFESQTHELPS